MLDRDLVYVQILNFGLSALKNAAHGGETAYWKIESDHLHNLPSLIGEPNEQRHDCYFNNERPLYLERVQYCKYDTRFTLARYREFWKRLDLLRSNFAS